MEDGGRRCEGFGGSGKRRIVVEGCGGRWREVWRTWRKWAAAEEGVKLCGDFGGSGGRRLTVAGSVEDLAEVEGGG